MAQEFRYRTRRLEPSGDIATSGKVWLFDIDAIAQTINTRINLFAGEFWRDVSDGTPWIDKILGKNNQANTLQSKSTLLKNRILNTEGVISIVKWSSDFSFVDRKFSVSATVLTEFGIIKIDEDLSEKDFVEDEQVQQLLVAVQNYVIATNGWTELGTLDESQVPVLTSAVDNYEQSVNQYSEI